MMPSILFVFEVKKYVRSAYLCQRTLCRNRDTKRVLFFFSSFLTASKRVAELVKKNGKYFSLNNSSTKILAV